MENQETNKWVKFLQRLPDSEERKRLHLSVFPFFWLTPVHTSERLWFSTKGSADVEVALQQVNQKHKLGGICLISSTTWALCFKTSATLNVFWPLWFEVYIFSFWFDPTSQLRLESYFSGVHGSVCSSLFGVHFHLPEEPASLQKSKQPLRLLESLRRVFMQASPWACGTSGYPEYLLYTGLWRPCIRETSFQLSV